MIVRYVFRQQNRKNNEQFIIHDTTQTSYKQIVIYKNNPINSLSLQFEGMTFKQD